MPLQVGDTTRFDGYNGTVIATTATLNADGRGSITYDGDTFQFRVLKCASDGGTDYGLSTGGADSDLRVGLVLRDGSSPALFCLWFEDLPAPIGWGGWVQGVGGTWAEAFAFANEDSLVMTVGRRYGPVTVQIGGVAVGDGAYIDLVLYHTEDEKSCRTWYQPAYPFNGLYYNEEAGYVQRDGTQELGCFVTDGGAGRVYYRHPDGTLEDHIILPRGIGALGNTASDTWVSGPTPKRVLTVIEAYLLQERVALEPNTPVTLNVAAVQIDIEGPPGARYRLFWEESLPRPTPDPTAYGTLDGSGEASVTSLPPGRYACELQHPSDITKGLAPESVDATDSGGVYTISFSATWNTCTAQHLQGVIMADWGTPASGAEVWHYTGEETPVWEVIGTAGEDGTFDIYPFDPGTQDIMFRHETYGTTAISGLAPGLGGWVVVCLGGRFGAIRSADSEVWPEGMTPWGYAGDHVNLPVPDRAAYVEDEDGNKHWFNAGSVIGVKTDILPRGKWSPPDDQDGWAACTYDLYSADGTLISAGLTLGGDHAAYWTDPTKTRRTNAAGAFVVATVGGKYEGPVIEAKQSALTAGALREPERIGLETGEWKQPYDHLSDSETAREGAGGNWYYPLTVCTWECPYCGGPVAGFRAVGLGYTRGFCQQCADYGVTTDCRGFLMTQTLASLQDWFDTIARVSVRGSFVKKRIPGWPRPAEYYENDDYLVENWQGLGVPRWAAVHIVLGTVVANAFTDGESIADAEARVGDTIGPVMLKLLLTADCPGGATVVVTATRADGGGSATLTGTVPAGAVAGDLVFLNWGPHDTYYGNPCKWYTDVTNAVVTSGTVSCQIVNDGPSWRDSGGIHVTHGAYSPFACDVRFLTAREPYLREDIWSALNLVYLREGAVMHVVREGLTWGEPYSVSAKVGSADECRKPCFECLPDSGMLVGVTIEEHVEVWAGEQGQTWTWERLATVNGVRLGSFVKDRDGFLHMAALDSSDRVVYLFSDTLGRTWSAPVAVSEEAVENDEPPAIRLLSRDLCVLARQNGATQLWLSQDGGHEWALAGATGGTAATMLADDLDLAALAERWSCLRAAGLVGGAVFVEWSDQYGRRKFAAADGAFRWRVSEDESSETPGIEVDCREQEWVAVATAEDTVRVYRSQDGGQAFEFVEAFE